MNMLPYLAPWLLGALIGEAGYQGRRIVSDKSRQYRAAIASPKNAEYVRVIQAEEKRAGLPAGLLLRVAWQESRFNPNAVSPAGARGMFQLMPLHKINAFDWRISARYAADELLRLYRVFAIWERAVKAYNCGEKNLKVGSGKCRSAETLGYWADISADVPGLTADQTQRIAPTR